MKLNQLAEAVHHTMSKPKTGLTSEQVLTQFFEDKSAVSNARNPDIQTWNVKDNLIVYDGQDQVLQVRAYKQDNGWYYDAVNDRYGEDNSWETHPDTYEIRQTIVVYKG